MSRRRRQRFANEDGGLDLTSLLDVIFNLVFFFVVATTIRTDQSFFEVTLPLASEGTPLQPQQALPEISVAKDGSLALDGEPMESASIEQLLTVRLQDAAPNARVVLSADGEATVQQTTRAMDMLRRAGATQVIQRLTPATGLSNP